MHKGRISLIAALLLLAALISSLGWLVYAPVRQERLNRALIAAIKQNNTNKALALLAEGADANVRDDPPRHLSLWRRLMDRLRGKRPAPSTAPTALQLACSWDAGKGRVSPESPVRYTPENPVLVRALLDRGARIEGKDEVTGMTPLLLSFYNDETQVSRLLIERGANVNPAVSTETSWMYGTPLIHAAAEGDKGLVRLLLNRGANVNAIGDSDDCCGTPLIAAQWAEDKDDPTITKLLLSRGAKVNVPMKNPEDWMWSPLTAAIYNHRSKTASILVKHGANVNFKSYFYDTPLDEARVAGDHKMIQMLKQAGAKE